MSSSVSDRSPAASDLELPTHCAQGRGRATFATFAWIENEAWLAKP